MPTLKVPYLIHRRELVSISLRSMALIEKSVKDAGIEALKLFRKPSLSKKFKSERDLVTEADEAAERSLIKNLSVVDDISFLSEEFNPGTKLENKPLWIIDPIDGTTNFASGIAPFAVSVAHYDGNSVDAAVCYLPVTDELFSAYIGNGAFMNGERIYVNNESNPMQCVAATGFADITHNEPLNTVPVFAEVIKKVRTVRRLGSAVADLVYTAAGRFAFFYEAGLSPWDVAAGTLIVKEAGGIVTDFEGGDNYLTGKTVIASNPAIYSFIKKEIETYYGKIFNF
jgi:myo-inositol-1(or 4)-monophosphatase